MMYEVYREKFIITEWRDGAIWATRSEGCDWFPEDVVQNNRAFETNVLYVAASDDFALTHATIRKART